MVGPGEHGRGSQSAADLVWFLHIDNTASRAARQGIFNPELVCVYAHRRGLIYRVPGSDGINRSGSRWFESSSVSLFFEGGLLWRFTASRRRDPELESATAFLLCLSLLCGTFVDCFCIFTTAFATSLPLWEIQRECDKLFAARS